MAHVSSILFGDIIEPNIENTYMLLSGVFVYEEHIFLLGGTTNKRYTCSHIVYTCAFKYRF